MAEHNEKDIMGKKMAEVLQSNHIEREDIQKQGRELAGKIEAFKNSKKPKFDTFDSYNL